MSVRRVEPPERIESALVVTHTQPGQTDAALERIAEIAADRGVALYAEPDERERHEALGAAFRPAEELGGAADVCLVLGGDGTILRALRRTAGSGTPVFGFNFGTVGFLAATGREGLDEALTPALEGAFEVMALPGLRCDASGVERPLALNDISLIRGQGKRVAELAYSVGGTEIANVRCDGVVAATPAGSTGYNLANAGPILAWGVQGYVVSFIAPHTLTGRALVVAPGDVLRISNARGRDPVDIAFDGSHEAELGSGEAVEIAFSEDVSRLAQLSGSSFYDRVLEKFGPLAR